MENFLKVFLDKNIGYSFEKIPISVGDSAESNIIKFLQKIILKHDVVVELKNVVNAVCSSEKFNVNSNVIQNLIQQLRVLLLSKEDTETKSNIFRWVFMSFTSYCKEDESVRVIQYFVLLSHILGVNSLPDVSSNKDMNVNLVNEENFKAAFKIDGLPLSAESLVIFKDLLHCLSKTSIILSSSEVQVYFNWLQQLMKNLAYQQSFLCILLEIFLTSAEVDFRLLEGSLEHIFKNILTLQSPPDENFSNLYGFFMERTLNICAKFQRTIKFVTKLLTSVKVTPTALDKDLILPSNAIREFSKTVATTSNQYSLSIFDVLLENLKECFDLMSETASRSELLLFMTSRLLVGFLKEMKLFAPSIASTTLQAFINKINVFKKVLQDIGSYLFRSKSVKNEDTLRMFLELCFYCGEIETLVICYKDSILPSSDSDWECCITQEQWNKLVKCVLKSKIKTCDSICIQLALQKLRIRQLMKLSSVEDSTLEVLMYEFDELEIFQQVSPQDVPILTEELTVRQIKSFAGSLFKQALKAEAAAAWLTHSAVKENLVFIASLFSEMLKQTGSLVQSKNNLSLLSEECFDDENVIRAEVMESLPEELNLLLRNIRKVRKFVSKHPERRDSLASIVKIFKLLPLPYMNNDFKKLGMSFALGTGVLLASDETTASLAFESVYNFLTTDTDASTCFNVGLCLKWLSELCYESKSVDSLRVMVIESLIRNSPKMQFGLQQISEVIDSPDVLQQASPWKRIESRILLYNELGKCWQRPKKRKSDNDLIGSYRTKLAKIISLEAKELENNNINLENSKMLMKIFAIELNKAIKTNEKSELKSLTKEKLPSYFEFAVKNLCKNFDESSAMFLIIVLQSMAQLQKYLPQDSLLNIWKALKYHEKVNWRLFSDHSNNEEFKKILTDLLKMSKRFLTSESDKHSSNCFEIWVSFFEFSPELKRNSCQFCLQEFFSYIHDCDLCLRDLPIRKKIFLIKFFSFCLTTKKVVVTSDMLDTTIHLMLEILDGFTSTEEFHELFLAELNAASAILLKQFAWSRSKVHLIYIIFKRFLAALMTKCNAGEEVNKDDVLKLANCGLSLEKWVSLIISKEKDFARISAYFITSLISSIASVTVIPAIKIHLTNCINSFLSISDSHTVTYLMRVLKPGYQQVFSTLYSQFRKYHKYSGKI